MNFLISTIIISTSIVCSRTLSDDILEQLIEPFMEGTEAARATLMNASEMDKEEFYKKLQYLHYKQNEWHSEI